MVLHVGTCGKVLDYYTFNFDCNFLDTCHTYPNFSR